MRRGVPSESPLRVPAARNEEPSQHGIDPGLMHRIAVIGAGTLDILPHNGAVITLLAVCGCTHRESYLDIVMVAIVSSVLALAAVILLGSLVGSL
jgi:H+/gluconate symporter-like permease